MPDLRLWTALLVVFVDDLILDWAHGQRAQPLDPVDMEGERDGSAAGMVQGGVPHLFLISCIFFEKTRILGIFARLF